MGVTVAGIAGMSLAQTRIVDAKIGDRIDIGGYQWTLMNLHDEQGPNYTARVADLFIARNGKPLALVHPSRRTFPLQQQTTSDVSIQTNLFRDLYSVLGEEHDGRAVLRLHVNWLAPWIWLGALIMAAGGALSLADRRLRVGAPARARGKLVPA
jgi:cytochrome c-type biogenesis protein CcmF